MVRVLHVHSGNLYGGVERVLTTLMKVPPTTGELQHEIALCFEGRLRAELDALGIRVHSLGPVRIRHPWTVLTARLVLRRLLRSAKYDAVLIHSPWAQAIFGPTVGAADVRHALWIHDVVDGSDRLQRWSRRTRPDVLIANSRFVAERVGRMFPGAAVHVVYPPVVDAPEDDESKRAATRRALGVNPDERVIVHLSRLDPLKGHGLLLDALTQLRDLPGWVCWIAGEPQREEEARYLDGLQVMTAANGLVDRVRFIGRVGDVHGLLGAADVYCQPNVQPEAFGLTFVEAMLHGMPVVTTAMGGAVEIVDGCGWLVPPGDAAELASTLRSLITSPEHRARYAAEGKDRASRFTDASAQARLLASLLGTVPTA